MGKGRRKAKRKKVMTIAALIAAGLILGGGYYYWANYGPKPDPANDTNETIAVDVKPGQRLERNWDEE